MVWTRKLLQFFKLSFGNIIEWYDFSLYIYFAGAIAGSFFPSSSSFASMLLALATFFIGCIIRPLGGVICGMIGDRFGYRFVINLCVITMGISTLLVAFLPTYAQLGWIAPLLLVLLRLLQGLSVGGQFPSLLTLGVSEHADNKGFTAGLVFSISSLGFLLASLTGTFSEYLCADHPQLIWRMPFALSGIFFVIYLWLNRNEHFEAQPDTSPATRPALIPALVHQWREIITVVLLTTMCASLYFLVFTYLIHYQIAELDIGASSAFLLNSIVLLLACLLYPTFGHIADHFGCLRLFVLGLLALMILTWPLLHAFNTQIYPLMLGALGLLTIIMAAIQGAVAPFFAAIFRPEWQASACALAYSLGNGISGSAPMVADTFVHYFGHQGLVWYALSLVAIGSIGALMIFRHLQKAQADAQAAPA